MKKRFIGVMMAVLLVMQTPVSAAELVIRPPAEDSQSDNTVSDGNDGLEGLEEQLDAYNHSTEQPTEQLPDGQTPDEPATEQFLEQLPDELPEVTQGEPQQRLGRIPCTDDSMAIGEGRSPLGFADYPWMPLGLNQRIVIMDDGRIVVMQFIDGEYVFRKEASSLSDMLSDAPDAVYVLVRCDDESIVEQLEGADNFAVVKDLFVLQYKKKSDAKRDIKKIEDDVEFAEINRDLDVSMAEITQLPAVVQDAGTDSAAVQDAAVAILDTGINLESQALIGRYEDTGYNFVDGGSIADDNGHGTVLANIVAGATGRTVRVLPIKVADSDGKASILSVYLGILAAREMKADVINISMNAKSSGKSEALEMLIRDTVADGIMVVASAGNTRKDVRDIAPANLEEAVVVTAVDKDKNLEEYSNYGGTVDYCAYGYDSSGTNGTSNAAARVSAFAATAVSRGQNPWEMLEESAVPLGDSDKFGKGFIDLDDLDIKTVSDDYNLFSVDWKAISDEELRYLVMNTNIVLLGAFISELSLEDRDLLKARVPMLLEDYQVCEYDYTGSDGYDRTGSYYSDAVYAYEHALSEDEFSVSSFMSNQGHFFFGIYGDKKEASFLRVGVSVKINAMANTVWEGQFGGHSQYEQWGVKYPFSNTDSPLLSKVTVSIPTKATGASTSVRIDNKEYQFGGNANNHEIRLVGVTSKATQITFPGNSMLDESSNDRGTVTNPGMNVSSESTSVETGRTTTLDKGTGSPVMTFRGHWARAIVGFSFKPEEGYAYVPTRNGKYLTRLRNENETDASGKFSIIEYDIHSKLEDGDERKYEAGYLKDLFGEDAKKLKTTTKNGRQTVWTWSNLATNAGLSNWNKGVYDLAVQKGDAGLSTLIESDCGAYLLQLVRNDKIVYAAKGTTDLEDGYAFDGKVNSGPTGYKFIKSGSSRVTTEIKTQQETKGGSLDLQDLYENHDLQYSTPAGGQGISDKTLQKNLPPSARKALSIKAQVAKNTPISKPDDLLSVGEEEKGFVWSYYADGHFVQVDNKKLNKETIKAMQESALCDDDGRMILFATEAPEAVAVCYSTVSDIGIPLKKADESGIDSNGKISSSKGQIAKDAVYHYRTGSKNSLVLGKNGILYKKAWESASVAKKPDDYKIAVTKSKNGTIDLLSLPTVGYWSLSEGKGDQRLAEGSEGSWYFYGKDGTPHAISQKPVSSSSISQGKKAWDALQDIWDICTTLEYGSDGFSKRQTVAGKTIPAKAVFKNGSNYYVVMYPLKENAKAYSVKYEAGYDAVSREAGSVTYYYSCDPDDNESDTYEYVERVGRDTVKSTISSSQVWGDGQANGVVMPNSFTAPARIASLQSAIENEKAGAIAPNTAAGSLQVPSVFEGWYSGTSADHANNIGDSRECDHNVVFNTNTGEEREQDMDVSIGMEENYPGDGWVSAADDKDRARAVHAHWLSQPVTLGMRYDRGFSFLGWYPGIPQRVKTTFGTVDADGKVEVEDAGETGEVELEADTAFYPGWLRLQYTVTFDYGENGGKQHGTNEAAVKRSTYYSYELDELPTDAEKDKDTGIYSPTNPDGWQFVGWSFDKNDVTGVTTLEQLQKLFEHGNCPSILKGMQVADLSLDPSANGLRNFDDSAAANSDVNLLAAGKQPACDLTLYAIYKKTVTATYIDYQYRGAPFDSNYSIQDDLPEVPLGTITYRDYKAVVGDTVSYAGEISGSISSVAAPIQKNVWYVKASTFNKVDDVDCATSVYHTMDLWNHDGFVKQGTQLVDGSGMMESPLSLSWDVDHKPSKVMIKEDTVFYGQYSRLLYVDFWNNDKLDCDPITVPETKGYQKEVNGYLNRSSDNPNRKLSDFIFRRSDNINKLTDALIESPKQKIVKEWSAIGWTVSKKWESIPWYKDSKGVLASSGVTPITDGTQFKVSVDQVMFGLYSKPVTLYHNPNGAEIQTEIEPIIKTAYMSTSKWLSEDRSARTGFATHYPNGGMFGYTSKLNVGSVSYETYKFPLFTTADAPAVYRDDYEKDFDVHFVQWDRNPEGSTEVIDGSYKHNYPDTPPCGNINIFNAGETGREFREDTTLYAIYRNGTPKTDPKDFTHHIDLLLGENANIGNYFNTVGQADTTLTYSASDPTIVRVDAFGLVTALKAGCTEITAYTDASVTDGNGLNKLGRVTVTVTGCSVGIAKTVRLGFTMPASLSVQHPDSNSNSALNEAILENVATQRSTVNKETKAVLKLDSVSSIMGKNSDKIYPVKVMLKDGSGKWKRIKPGDTICETTNADKVSLKVIPERSFQELVSDRYTSTVNYHVEYAFTGKDKAPESSKIYTGCMVSERGSSYLFLYAYRDYLIHVTDGMSFRLTDGDPSVATTQVFGSGTLAIESGSVRIRSTDSANGRALIVYVDIDGNSYVRVCDIAACFDGITGDSRFYLQSNFKAYKLDD